MSPTPVAIDVYFIRKLHEMIAPVTLVKPTNIERMHRAAFKITAAVIFALHFFLVVFFLCISTVNREHFRFLNQCTYTSK